jgi:hypothetical protein
MKRTTTILLQNDVSSTYVSKKRRHVNSNPLIGLLSVLLISFFFSSSAHAQQKSANVQQAEAQLIVVNEKIAEIDAKITAINSRIAGIPAENVDPSVFVRLNDLQITKDQYLREKISIEAVLENDQDTMQSDFYTLPDNDRDHIVESGTHI